jgi:tRNA nucleotidyltransferase/poly(A) polymerase
MFNENEERIIKTLIANGYQIYLVGGAVRDTLLNKTPKDFDFATNATPDILQTLFKDRNLCFVGKTFKVVIIDNIEVATFRKDRHAVLYNAKKCICSYAETIEEDLSRRDLTINAMAYDLNNVFNYTIIDPFNGLHDLTNGIIRFVGDAEQRIKEDPVRIIRACRMLATIEGTFNKETLNILQRFSFLIEKHVAKERIAQEIMKAMEVDTPSLFFSALYLIGALKYIFPSMVSCFNHEHGKYHKETVSEHLLQAGDNISKKFPILRLATFLHDIGKPTAYYKRNDGSFVQHEHYGSTISEKELRNLKFSNEIINKVSQLVYSHMLQCRSLKPSSARRLRKRLADRRVDARDFIRMKIADRLANVVKTKSEITPIKELIINSGIKPIEEEIPFTVKSLAISGGELINIFNLEPGPIVGILQRSLLNYVIEEGMEVNTKKLLILKIHLLLKDIQC